MSKLLLCVQEKDKKNHCFNPCKDYLKIKYIIYLNIKFIKKLFKKKKINLILFKYLELMLVVE